MNENPVDTAVTVYDEFSGTRLDSSKWYFLEMPAPDGSMWRCEEPKALTELANGRCTLTVKQFERSHDGVQILDNPKHLLLSTTSFEIPDEGARRFSVDFSAQGLNGDRHDYRDAFAAFNVLDMTSGLVFDIALSGEHAYAIHEQLPISPKARHFTHIVENPLAGIRPVAGKPMRCEIDFDKSQQLVRWRVDGVEIFHVKGVAIPDRVQLGFGLFTLHPIHEGRSRSLKGQGLTASWGRFTISTPTRS
jgi:hypothetical protein